MRTNGDFEKELDRFKGLPIEPVNIHVDSALFSYRAFTFKKTNFDWGMGGEFLSFQ